MSGESSASVQSDISKVLGGDGCKATDEIGNVCGETGNFGILEHFQRIYADRMKKCGDNDKLAVSILKSWVHDLTEQNTMLVHTVEELERELLKRVDMMHEQLQKTNYIINRKSLLAKQEKDAVEVSLRQQVELLQNDVSSLLDVINQAQHQGIRPVNSLKLNTVSRNQIIGFSQSSEVDKPTCTSDFTEGSFINKNSSQDSFSHHFGRTSHSCHVSTQTDTGSLNYFTTSNRRSAVSTECQVMSSLSENANVDSFRSEISCHPFEQKSKLLKENRDSKEDKNMGLKTAHTPPQVVIHKTLDAASEGIFETSFSVPLGQDNFYICSIPSSGDLEYSNVIRRKVFQKKREDLTLLSLQNNSLSRQEEFPTNEEKDCAVKNCGDGHPYAVKDSVKRKPIIGWFSSSPTESSLPPSLINIDDNCLSEVEHRPAALTIKKINEREDINLHSTKFLPEGCDLISSSDPLLHLKEKSLHFCQGNFLPECKGNVAHLSPVAQPPCNQVVVCTEQDDRKCLNQFTHISPKTDPPFIDSFQSRLENDKDKCHLQTTSQQISDKNGYGNADAFSRDYHDSLETVTYKSLSENETSLLSTSPFSVFQNKEYLSAQSMPQEGNPEDSQELVNGEVDNLKFQLSEKEAEISNYLERFEELKGVLTLSTQQPASSKCEFRSKGADKEEDSSLQCSFTAPSYANDNKSHDETSWIKESLKKQHDQVISLTAKSLELETNLRMAILQRDNLAQELQSLLSNQPSLSEIETQTSIDPYVVQIKLELDTTRQNLLSATKQVKLLSAHLKETDKVNRETQAALTVEVAEKHDQMLALKKEVQQLEEQLKQALVQKNFKDEIILQMRNELKIARNKLANEAGTDTDNKSRRFTYPSIPETGSVNDSGIDDGEISVSSRSSNVEVDQLLQKISDRDQELNVQKEKVAKLERELEALQNAPFKEAPSKPSLITLRELEEYRLCTVEAQAAVEDLKDEIEAITSDMKIQEEKMESFIKAVAASEDKLRNAHLKLAKALQIDPSGDLQILDNIQDVLAEAKDCMQDIRTKAEEFVRDRGRSEQRRTSRERKVDKLQGQLDNAHDNMRDGIEAIEQVLAERYEADSLSQREFSDGSYHSCRESDSSSCIKQVQHLEEQNAELLNTLAKVENQKRDMEVRAAQYLRELDRMKDQVGRRDFTDEMLNTKEQTIHELQGTLDSARRQMRELQLELERLTRERDGLKHLADQSTGCSPSQVADLQSELARVRNQLATVASKQALIEQYERRFQETSEQTEKLSTQLNSLSLNLQAKEKMLSNKEEMVSILQDTLDRTREELKLLKDKSGGSSSSSKGAEEGASGANGGRRTK